MTLKNMNRIIVGIVLSISLSAVFGQDEAYFYVDKIDLVDQTVDLVADYGANGSDELDDSQALQNAIDALTANPNGGKIIIPAGTFYLLDIHLKDNVHIVIDPDAVIKPSASSGIIFRYGYHHKGSSAAVTIRNVSIRCSQEGGKYTVDYSEAPSNPNKIHFVNCKNVVNFMIADFFIRDNWTKISAISMSAAGYDGQWWRPENGVIKNGDMSMGHYGYGLIQMQVGKKVLFKDLAGTGGVTVRLESGAVPHTPDWMNMDSIWVRNVSSTDGHGALMMGPHTKDNGHVDADGVTSIGSLWAVGAGGGYVTNEEDSLGYTPGSFASTCVVTNIHAVYGEIAQLKSKNFDEIPCAIRHLISTEPVMDGKIYIGPASCAVHSTNEEKANPYTILWSNITTEGFEHQFKLILKLADENPDCNPVPVSGIALSKTSLDLEATQTAQLTATVSPSEATDPSVIWISADTTIATVDNTGLVTAIDSGSTFIIVKAVDGGYPDTCEVAVTSDPGTGIGEQAFEMDSQNLSIMVYPNPASDVINLKINTESRGQIYLHVYDLSGQLLDTRILGAMSQGIHFFELSMDDLEIQSGAYFFAVSDKTSTCFKKVLIY